MTGSAGALPVILSFPLFIWPMTGCYLQACAREFCGPDRMLNKALYSIYYLGSLYLVEAGSEVITRSISDALLWTVEREESDIYPGGYNIYGHYLQVVNVARTPWHSVFKSNFSANSLERVKLTVLALLFSITFVTLCKLFATKTKILYRDVKYKQIFLKTQKSINQSKKGRSS